SSPGTRSPTTSRGKPRRTCTATSREELSLEIRSATPADVPEILDVLRAALGEPPGLQRTEALWNWKHVDNPFGPSIVLVAESGGRIDRKSTRLNSSHVKTSYAVFCLKNK